MSELIVVGDPGSTLAIMVPPDDGCGAGGGGGPQVLAG